MRIVLFWCGVPVVVTALLIAKVNTENITTRMKIFQRSAREEVLFGHVIQSTKASSDIDCLIDCSREQRCLSFNYKSNRDDGNPVCELNDQTRESRPDSVVSVDGYYYYGPESSCTSDRCLNGGTCHPIIDDPHQRYQCQCSPGFTGERCQDDLADFDIIFPRQSASDYVLMTKMPHQLTSFTISLFVNLTKDVDHTFFSYATTSYHNAIFVHQRSSVLQLWVNNNNRKFSGLKINADGKWHHLAITWTNSVHGQVSVYIDGIPQVTESNVAAGIKVPAGGIVAIGNDQDAYGGGFVVRDALCGSISRVNIWNTVLSSDAITSLAGKCGNEAGTTVAWKDFRKGAAGVSYHGEARPIVPSRCKNP